MGENKNNNFSLTWLPKKTFEILATVSWSEIEKAKKAVILKARETLEIKGFRKGKAPENIVAESLGANKLLQATLEKIIPDLYPKAISQFGLKPILSPKIDLVCTKENENWQIKFISCEEPEIKLGNYKEEIKGLKVVNSIWTPDKGTEPKKDDKADESEKKEEKLDKIIKWLSENIKIEMSELLLESEINRKLSELLEETQKLGISLEQYLTSTRKTVESLKQEYKTQVEKSLWLQFILNSIAETEKIEVKPEEIEKAIDGAKNEAEKKALESQKYLLASIIRQQKTLDFLANL